MNPRQRLHHTLASLQHGERAWFWISRWSKPPLLMTPLRDDPDLAQLSALIQRVGTDPDAVTGVAEVTPEGRISLLGPALTSAHLTLLEDLAAEQAHTAARRLAMPILQRLAPDGTVAERIEGFSLWEHEPDPAYGCLRGAAATLAGMAEDDTALFWLGTAGPDRGPHLVLERDADTFSQRVRDAILTSPDAGEAHQGVLSVIAGGAVLVVETPLDGLSSALSRLLDRPDLPAALRTLRGCRLLQVGDDTFTAGARHG